MESSQLSLFGPKKCGECDTVHAPTDICLADEDICTVCGMRHSTNWLHPRRSNAEEVYKPVTHLSFEAAVGEVLAEVGRLIVLKQRDYGHDNITAHGLTGLCVRMADKQARFHNLVCVNHGRDAANETLRDTVLDKIGYDLLTLMVLDETFQLPLTEDDDGGCESLCHRDPDRARRQGWHRGALSTGGRRR